MGRRLAAADRRHPSRRSSRSSRRGGPSTIATRWSTFAPGPDGPVSACTARPLGRGAEIDRCWLTTDLGNAIRNTIRDWAEGGSGLRPGVRAIPPSPSSARVATQPGSSSSSPTNASADFIDEVLTAFWCARWSINDTPAEVTNLPASCSGARRRSRSGWAAYASGCGRTRSADEHAYGGAALSRRARRSGLPGETVYDPTADRHDRARSPIRR